MGSKLQLVGKRFSKLLVLSEEPKVANNYQWKCLCDCGNITIVRGSGLTSGNTKSCGCLQKEHAIKHNMVGTPEYNSWHSIKDRCLNPRCKDYPKYGALGITLCEEWVGDFYAFYKHIGPKPVTGEKWSVGRIDNTLGYCVGNVRWETAATQAMNRSLSKKNNTGYNGIIKTSYIRNGKEYNYVEATFYHEVGNQIVYRLSLQQMSYENALKLALAWREEQINIAKSNGRVYSETHGVSKQ